METFVRIHGQCRGGHHAHHRYASQDSGADKGVVMEFFVIAAALAANTVVLTVLYVVVGRRAFNNERSHNDRLRNKLAREDQRSESLVARCGEKDAYSKMLRGQLSCIRGALGYGFDPLSPAHRRLSLAVDAVIADAACAAKEAFEKQRSIVDKIKIASGDDQRDEEERWRKSDEVLKPRVAALKKRFVELYKAARDCGLAVRFVVEHHVTIGATGDAETSVALMTAEEAKHNCGPDREWATSLMGRITAYYPDVEMLTSGMPLNRPFRRSSDMPEEPPEGEQLVLVADAGTKEFGDDAATTATGFISA